jgi:hypothetical protein
VVNDTFLVIDDALTEFVKSLRVRSNLYKKITSKTISVSTCTANTIKQYLQGTIPEDKGDDGPDVFCELDNGPFGLGKPLAVMALAF